VLACLSIFFLRLWPLIFANIDIWPSKVATCHHQKFFFLSQSSLDSSKGVLRLKAPFAQCSGGNTIFQSVTYIKVSIFIPTRYT